MRLTALFAAGAAMLGFYSAAMATGPPVREAPKHTVSSVVSALQLVSSHPSANPSTPISNVHIKETLKLRRSYATEHFLQEQVGLEFNITYSLTTTASFAWPQWDGSVLQLVGEGMDNTTSWYTFLPLLATQLTLLNITNKNGSVDQWCIQIDGELNSGHDQRRDVSSRASNEITVTQGDTFTLVIKEGAVAHWDTHFIKIQVIKDGAQRTYTLWAVMAGDTQVTVDGTKQNIVPVKIKLPSPASSARSRREFPSGISRRADEDVSVIQGNTFQLAIDLGSRLEWNPQFVTLQSVTNELQRTYTFNATKVGDTQILVIGADERTINVTISLPTPPGSGSLRTNPAINTDDPTEVLQVKWHETFSITVDEGAQAHEDPQFLEWFSTVTNPGSTMYTYWAITAGDTQITIDGADAKTILVKISLLEAPPS